MDFKKTAWWDKEWIALGALYLGLLALVVAFWVGASYMEARTYTKLTGKQVSTIDAMFLNLRVIEPAVRDNARTPPEE